jgi:hypothetical protein
MAGRGPCLAWHPGSPATTVHTPPRRLGGTGSAPPADHGPTRRWLPGSGNAHMRFSENPEEMRLRRSGSPRPPRDEIDPPGGLRDPPEKESFQFRGPGDPGAAGSTGREGLGDRNTTANELAGVSETPGGPARDRFRVSKTPKLKKTPFPGSRRPPEARSGSLPGLGDPRRRARGRCQVSETPGGVRGVAARSRRPPESRSGSLPGLGDPRRRARGRCQVSETPSGVPGEHPRRSENPEEMFSRRSGSRRTWKRCVRVGAVLGEPGRDVFRVGAVLGEPGRDVFASERFSENRKRPIFFNSWFSENRNRSQDVPDAPLRTTCGRIGRL